MSFRIPLLVTLMGVVCGCASGPGWYAPPAQYVFDPNAEPRLVGSIALMDDAFVENYILSGVLAGDKGSPWRWANDKAELRFQLGELKPVRFIVDFVIPHSTFEITGPVKMALSLNGKQVATMPVDKPGQQHWIVPVEAGQFDPVTPVVAKIEVNKFYQSEHDGTKLGFMLQRAGFEQ